MLAANLSLLTRCASASLQPTVFDSFFGTSHRRGAIGILFNGLVAFGAITFPWASSPSGLTEDGIIIQSMRVNGTIPKLNDLMSDFNTNPTDRIPTTSINGAFSPDEFRVVVTKDKVRSAAYMNFGSDKKLKEQALKLAGHAVMVECKGEFKPYAGKVEVHHDQVWYK